MAQKPLGQVAGGFDEVNGVAAGAQGRDNRLDGRGAVELRIPVEGGAVPPRLRQGVGGRLADFAPEVIG
jgi:hypothetical protein